MTEHILTTPGKSKKTVKSMGLGKLEVTKFLAWAKNNEKEIRNYLNDFNQIKEFVNSPNDYNILHRNAKQWLLDSFLTSNDVYSIDPVAYYRVK